MRAAVFHREGSPLSIEDRQTPTARPGEVVLRVAYCGICGTDLHATEKSAVPLEPDTVLGHEFSGTVAESAAPGWQQGDRIIGLPLVECDDCRPLGGCRDRLGILCGRTKVIGLAADAPGGYAEYLTLPAHNALRVPDAVDLREAALTEPLSVGAHAVRLAGGLLGARVLVIGGGPIGLAVTLFARAAGARHLVVSELDSVRRERAAMLGAGATIDPATGPVGPAFARIAGGAPDVIFECVGAPGLLRQCIEVAPVHGRIIVVGVCRHEDAILPRIAIRKELMVQFALGYTRDEFALVLDMLAARRIDCSALVSDVVGLDALPEMFESLRRPNPRAKVLIDPRL
ncbi:MAG TPA: alcohol dehydrogenase catalytic domain-containing protein [Acetobacteraceae bacterium]|nr:alcohol dehydrogenase catalytic domain-containing protein [Acetobacteraceae bacterium]